MINHEIPDRVPVIAQDAQVAAYLAGLNCIEYATDADKRASAIIEQRERFDYDGAIIGGDTVCLPEAVGVEVQYSETQGPRWKAGCLENYGNIDKLKLPDPMKDARLPVWVDTVKKVVEKIGNEYLVVGRADQGAFSLASMMRGMEDFFMDIACAASDEKLRRRLHRLLQYCNDCQFEFIKALWPCSREFTTLQGYHLCRFHASANGAVARGDTGSASNPAASRIEDSSGSDLVSHMNPTETHSMSQSPRPRLSVVEAIRYRRWAAKNAHAVPSRQPVPTVQGAPLHKAGTMPKGIRLSASSVSRVITIGPTEQIVSQNPQSNHGRPINVREAPRPIKPQAIMIPTATS